MLIVDQLDVYQMQNWDHLTFLFDMINQIPVKTRDTDFARLREWYVNEHAKYYRQTLLISEFISPGNL
jgi:U3 small nucleolar RNA-associated protein 25